jgi:FSR family fosmidomycin resistance protein-like MFS transporter
MLTVLVTAAGLGMAMFHPQATASITEPGSRNAGQAMGLFIAAGALGFSIGPTAIAALAEAVTLAGLWIATVPGAVIALLLFWFYHPKQKSHASGIRAVEPLSPSARRAMVLLFFLVCIRSVIQVTYGHLLPLYFTRELGYSSIQANIVVSLYFAAGAIGGMFGGRMADRFGGRRVIECSMLLSTPLLFLSFVTTGIVSILSLVAGGFSLLLTIPVNVMMAQNLAPDRRSTVSAVMMGFAWGITGIIFVPGTAWVADQLSLHTSLMGLTAFPLLGFVLARQLPLQN